MSRVYILLVNWNGWADTVKCLESVSHLDYPDFRIIVCDNASEDDSLVRIKAWAQAKSTPCIEMEQSVAENGGDREADPLLLLVKNRENLGFAGGNNVGLRYVQARGDADYVWLLNNDTVVDNYALAALVTRIREVPGAGMCGSTLLFHDRPDVVQALGGGYYLPWLAIAWHLGQRRVFKPGARPEKVETCLSYIVGASLLVSVEFVRVVGLMAEDYFLYFEEIDWTLRAGQRFKLAYAPDSLVYHKVGGSIGTRSHPGHKSLVCDYYNLRNRLVFTRKFYPWALPTVRLGLGLEALARLCCGRPRRALMVLKLMLSGHMLPPLSSFDPTI